MKKVTRNRFLTAERSRLNRLIDRLDDALRKEYPDATEMRTDDEWQTICDTLRAFTDPGTREY